MRKLSYTQVADAINRVHGYREGIEMGKLEAELAEILREYKAKNIFNGTVKSALRCFQKEDFDVESLLNRAE